MGGYRQFPRCSFCCLEKDILSCTFRPERVKKRYVMACWYVDPCLVMSRFPIAASFGRLFFWCCDADRTCIRILVYFTWKLSVSDGSICTHETLSQAVLAKQTPPFWNDASQQSVNLLFSSIRHLWTCFWAASLVFFFTRRFNHRACWCNLEHRSTKV